MLMRQIFIMQDLYIEIEKSTTLPLAFTNEHFIFVLMMFARFTILGLCIINLISQRKR